MSKIEKTFFKSSVKISPFGVLLKVLDASSWMGAFRIFDSSLLLVIALDRVCFCFCFFFSV